MAMLGDILAQARQGTAGLRDWLQDADPPLMAQIETEAARLGASPAGFVRAAIADFGRLATEEDWTTLMSGLRNTWDPGRAFVTGMVKWRLAGLTGPAERHEGAIHDR